ncbi:response regulator transcription factor [Microbaculum marinisediminis]|uniref:Response regulator n=1 Tax=Microbaculum marinisediminis TaxID=2931392 RepID=A0AAW5QVW7_9HYPH|nr:response regulator [Microbaculum sp. A6E488]MCT8970528.1 response regulator [Microbaculum sp. A6E488]
MPRHVLIVEDEENIVESLSFLLEREGFEVTSVLDGAQALDRIEEGHPDLLILDVMLPGIDGFEILRTIRANAALKALPVVMLTAKMQQQDRRTAEAIGVNAFVTKPFSNAEVVSIVKSLAP